MTTTDEVEEEGAEPLAAIGAPAGPDPAARPSRWRRVVRAVFGAPRAGEDDRRFGVRLALYGPLAFYVVLAASLAIFQVEGEAGLGITLMYWLFIGVSQVVYLIPGIGVALIAKRRGLAWGMVRGAGIIAVLDGVAWLVGYYVIGAR